MYVSQLCWQHKMVVQKVPVLVSRTFFLHKFNIAVRLVITYIILNLSFDQRAGLFIDSLVHFFFPQEV